MSFIHHQISIHYNAISHNSAWLRSDHLNSYSHLMRLSVPFSMIAISYVVTTTSHVRSFLRISFSSSSRSSLLPWRRRGRIEGQNRASSLIQFPSVERGTRIKWGPLHNERQGGNNYDINNYNNINIDMNHSSSSCTYVICIYWRRKPSREMVSKVLPRPTKIIQPLNSSTHFIGKNAVQTELVLIDKPIQSVNLVSSHFALNATWLDLNSYQFDILIAEQIILFLIGSVNTHSSSTM